MYHFPNNNTSCVYVLLKVILVTKSYRNKYLNVAKYLDKTFRIASELLKALVRKGQEMKGRAQLLSIRKAREEASSGEERRLLEEIVKQCVSFPGDA